MKCLYVYFNLTTNFPFLNTNIFSFLIIFKFVGLKWDGTYWNVSNTPFKLDFNNFVCDTFCLNDLVRMIFFNFTFFLFRFLSSLFLWRWILWPRLGKLFFILLNVDTCVPKLSINSNYRKYKRLYLLSELEIYLDSPLIKLLIKIIHFIF